jgi:hypothetical protein
MTQKRHIPSPPPYHHYPAGHDSQAADFQSAQQLWIPTRKSPNFSFLAASELFTGPK